ncbi:synaptotagmin-6 isoform X1 [Nasonia vitripennis]|uniref:C2 domain-containing protein n=2 Tax=Nasonia vitripennis TaxID=7425 RepID=A0A7M7T6L4_NASVI|nr:synaptotagmin-6 isoform X1 [Nasonia vitripennis]XP_031777995.1 synaptotagmin-6 isoform X1 [Nasonia vitripennis]
MVSSAVLGAAAGTGLALVIAVTIVVYRYYSTGRKVKSWSSLDRWPEPPKCPSLNQSKVVRQQLPSHHQDNNDPEACRVLNQSKTCYYSVQKTELSVAKEQHAVQSSSAASESSAGQSRSSHMGLVMGRTLTSLSRRPSSGSQEQLPATPPSGEQQHHHHTSASATPSPQIRAYGPDGRHHNHELLHAASSYPPSRGSRSPSPVRAASLDARCPSPMPGGPAAGTAAYSLTSLTSSQPGLHQPPQLQHQPLSCASSSSGNSTPSKSGQRCLSPLLIPPPRASFCAGQIGDGNSAPPASPIGTIRPDLYTRRDGPLFLSNSTRRSGKSLGRLHLRLSYDFDKSDLNVHLIEANELAGSDAGGFNDPYVKLSLSPEVDARKRQTPIHRNEPNPVFDQQFKFPVSHEELQDRTLLLQVLDYDRFSRNDVVGSLRIDLEDLELGSASEDIEVWGEISRERKPPEETQEVLISLSYLPSAERLTLVVLQARNLFPAPGKDSLDPFVKVGLLCGEKRVKKKKTAVRKATRCPVWEEAMSFNVPASSLGSTAIEICVLDSSSELIGNNAIVGSCIVGPGIGTATNLESGAANSSKEHWQNMTQSPRKAVAMWHTLH